MALAELNQAPRGYVDKRADVLYDGHNGEEINLGLATSPIGPAPELGPALQARNPLQELSLYPSDPLHKETRRVVVAGLGLASLTYESLIFHDNGSYGAGDEMIRYLATHGYDTVLTPTYSFPNVSQWAIRHGVRYAPLEDGSLDPLASIAQVLDMKRELEQKIVYLDYPNNPFGIANPNLVRDITGHVLKNGGLPLIDLAFGEVLGDEFSQAIQDVVAKGGVCLGSLSKTQGLPGLRTGYAVIPNEFYENGYSGSQRLVFGLSREAEFVYQRLFEPQKDGVCLAKKHAARVAEYNKYANLELIAGLQKLGLRIARTDLRTPIQTVISPIPDFYTRLAREGMVTESLHDYQETIGTLNGYGNSAVRMLTPKPGQIPEVLRRVERALKD